ncbi:precorrin-6Y C(5,15)-methyltransferase (decarboxylating) [Roseibium sp. TrichSKD4]|uniref:bifunctional cobalt-precorrin-7 (C(5))-methyltransferase/cobalt-precorrin-6B (C(15))-methyltransferase n=1 Tax=Roseibium sp. TrichSKD4 TaxID=744980 RepID=UPI0001E563B5|nr:bifunctional cobalt-precorrin-7 (C(5))-methyltransferase/cobalt-precorrin-6B (C(15))-methyltransferase [Roseibium sp. TrichSKD4]EFO33047.1 precorrin-6Y C(5,15)-methyltransferase (decarboxylating) [Roseibium sp. TrichSKD4]
MTSGKWLSLIGMGEDGSLPSAARHMLSEAEVIYGGARHFELVGPVSAEQRTWPSPFSDVYDHLKALRGKKVAVLATGDPQWFGIGSTLAKHFPASEMDVLPSLSAFQLAASRLGWAVQDTECLSLHGRPVETLKPSLYPSAQILALTSNSETPTRVADILTDAGFGPSRMTVLEHMGGAQERIVSGVAESWREDVADFHTLAIEVRSTPGQRFLAVTPGLSDDAFHHDGKMTKREIRAVTLSALEPHPGAVLWDIGAGCGSVGIEWLRAAPRTKAIGLEPHDERRAMADLNALELGVPQFDVRNASAPDGLDGLPTPDAIFIGGGLTTPGIVEICHKALKPGGRLVANAVTLEGEAVIQSAWTTFGGELTRLSVQRASAVGGLTGWRPLMPVTQWSFVKS